MPSNSLPAPAPILLNYAYLLDFAYLIDTDNLIADRVAVISKSYLFRIRHSTT